MVVSHGIPGSMLQEDCNRRLNIVHFRQNRSDPPHITFHSFFSPLFSVGNALLGTFQDLNVKGLRIRSDNGSQLTSSRYEKHLRTLGIKHETIHAHTPEEDG